MEEAKVEENYLIYDGDCPVCGAYVAMSRLRQLYPNVQVMNARSEPARVAKLRGEGYEINEGMILSLDGKIYFGADAMRMIASLGRLSSSPWRRTTLAFLGAAPWAKRLYPLLNRGRRVLLRTLGRHPIA
jgi:predicted DCC family thiol-disulfide oxidoreductase YuxK